MRNGAIEFRLRSAAIPGFCNRDPLQVRLIWFIFVSLAAVCVGCQSIPGGDRSSVVSSDLSLPPLPALEEDGDGEAEPRRASDADSDPAEDLPDRETRPFLGFPIGKLLDDSAAGADGADDPTDEERPAVRDIRHPGPDISNFPDSPFTLRQGRFYLETSPVFLSGPSRGTPATFNSEFLLRYGLTDRVELRLFSNGPTFERGRDASNGMAPLAWDIKTNLWGENLEYHIPAVGLEVFLLTPSGSAQDQPRYSAIHQLALRAHLAVQDPARVERRIGWRPFSEQ